MEQKFQKKPGQKLLKEKTKYENQRKSLEETLVQNPNYLIDLENEVNSINQEITQITNELDILRVNK